MVDHIVRFTENSWELTHTLACPQNLLKCPLTEAMRQLTEAPKLGQYEIIFDRTRERIRLGAEIPIGFPMISRRTTHEYAKRGLDFKTHGRTK